MTSAGETPAAAAMSRRVTASGPRSPNSRNASSRILARAVRSSGSERTLSNVNVGSDGGKFRGDRPRRAVAVTSGREPGHHAGRGALRAEPDGRLANLLTRPTGGPD